MNITKEEALKEVAGITGETYYDWRPNKANCLRGVWSKSELHYASHNPHQWAAGQKKEIRACMQFGSLVDCLMTEPEKFEQTYVVTEENDARKKGYLDAKKEAEASGRQILKKDDLACAERIIESILAHPEGRLMVTGAAQEVFTGTVGLEGPEGKVWVALKGKPDFVIINEEHGYCDIYDLKVTGVTSDDEITRIARSLGYHWQEEIYRRLAEQSGLHVRSFKFVFGCSEIESRVRVASFGAEARTGAQKALLKAWSMVYALGTGHIPAELEPKELVIGGRYLPDRQNHYWDSLPEIEVPLVNVEW